MTKDALHEFIAAARQKKVSDYEIIHLLIEEGWDAEAAQTAVLGVAVPKPSHDEGLRGRIASLSALEAALHHILLWLFSACATIVIAALSAALFGDNPDGDAASTYLAVTGVTFIAYAVFYGRYLLRLRTNIQLMTSRVWSIITIVLHSIGLISSLIIIVIAVIDGTDQDDKAVLIAGISIAAINALIVCAYAVANFSRDRKLRIRILPAYIIFVTAVLVVFGILAAFRLEPVRADNETKEKLTHAVADVRNYTNDHHVLPDSLKQTGGSHDVIQYTRIDDMTYKLCADFRLASGDGRDTYTQMDDYVESYTFDIHTEGIDCFELQSAALQEAQPDDVREKSFE